MNCLHFHGVDSNLFLIVIIIKMAIKISILSYFHILQQKKTSIFFYRLSCHLLRQRCRRRCFRRRCRCRCHCLRLRRCSSPLPLVFTTTTTVTPSCAARGPTSSVASPPAGEARI